MTKTLGIDAGGWFAEIYTDDDGDTGYGDHARSGRWYGTREQCEAVDPREVKVYPTRSSERPDDFDLACERRFD